MNSFDVVAIGVADESSEVAGMVFGPDTRFMQHLSACRDGCITERDHGFSRWSRERDMGLSESVACLEWAEPEAWEVDPIADAGTKVDNSARADLLEEAS